MKEELSKNIVRTTDKLWNWVFYGCEGKPPKYANEEENKEIDESM